MRAAGASHNRAMKARACGVKHARGTFMARLQCWAKAKASPVGDQDMRQWLHGPKVAMRLLAAAPLLGTSACRETRQIDAPPPASRAVSDTLAPMPPSVVDVPVSYDLAPVITALEGAVP